MNNKALNKEFSQMIRNKNQVSKTGFTDSEEEDDTSKSLKSPKSARSSLSGRSLLSGRSPRDEKITQFRRNEQKKFSVEKSDEDISPRRFSVSSKAKNLSPKSPRTFEESSVRYPKISHSRSQSRDDDEDIFSKKMTPRSPHSSKSDRDDLDSIDMMRTMRRPMHADALMKTKRVEEISDFENTKSRTGTPTKDSRYKRMESGLNAKTNFYTKRMHTLESDILEENSRSGKTTPTRSDSRHDVDEELSKHSRSDSPRYLRSKSDSPKSPGRNRSLLDEDEYPKYEENHEEAKSSSKQDNSLRVQNDRQNSRKLEKDPEVEDTIEDKKITEKLHREREQKRLSREARTKNMTDSSKKIEDAIEQIENTMEDSLRFKNLKELTHQLKYPSKPTLEEMLKMERSSRKQNKGESGNSRTRSLSASSRIDRPLSSKYANVKPRTQTRLQIQSARLNDELNFSKQDMMNDSTSLRENIYTEWYLKKMQDAQQRLKEAKIAQKNQEEKKAQELIEKLQKSKLIFDMWKEKKDHTIKEKVKSLKKNVKSQKEIEEEKLEKKKEAEIAFKEWTRKKKEFEEEQKEERLKKERENEKKKRTETKKPPRAPVSYDTWATKKKEEIKEKLSSKKKEEKNKEAEEMEKRKKKELAEKSFYEWLDKKEQDDFKKSKGLSTSMSALPPFYPNSKIIPFGR